jgi:hypothetical protein
MGITPNFIPPNYQPASVSLPKPAASSPRRMHWAPLNLVDPITRKKLNLMDPFKDRLLRLNAWDRFLLETRNIFVTLPKNIYQGLKGDPNYSFADFLNISRAPYYLGGAFLAASFAAGRAKLNFTRQSLAVGLYFSALALSNRLIEKMYKFRTGADLNLRYYKTSTGDIEKALSSADFPRFDLLEDSDYERMAKKMKIPDNIADRKREVNEQLRQIISTARADKLILGNMLAAFGAGYLAQTDAWFRLAGPKQGTWLAMSQGSLPARIKNTALSLWGHAERGVQEQVIGYSGELGAKQRIGFLGVVGGLSLLTLGHVWWTTRKKSYEVALPEMEQKPAIGLSPVRPPEGPLKTSSAFSAFASPAGRSVP